MILLGQILPIIDQVYPQGRLGKPRRGSRWLLVGWGREFKGKGGIGVRLQSNLSEQRREPSLADRRHW